MQAPKFVSKRRLNPDIALQITSMADIFIIILVFLLKSHGTGATNISPSAGLKLPIAATDGEQVEALKIEISEKAVQVDDKPVSQLTNRRFDPRELEVGMGVAATLEPAIKLARKRQELIAQSNSDVKTDKKVLLIADQRTPYVTLKAAILTAAVHGFNELKLVVVKKD